MEIDMTGFKTGSMVFVVALMLLAGAPIAVCQDAATVPSLIKFSGAVESASNHVIGVTFALYKDERERIPLWIETQNVLLDDTGRFDVQLGATVPEGMPKELFASGEARWISVQPQGQPEQPRVLLLSVPYALKAADAQTLGGLPASAFVLANSGQHPLQPGRLEDAVAHAGAALSQAASTVTTKGGTANTLPLFT